MSFGWFSCGLGSLGVFSAELSHSFKVSDRRRNTQKSAQNRSESLCAGLRAPCQIFGLGLAQLLGPNPARNRRFPAGSLKVVGAFVVQQRIYGFKLR